jgi:hypothetical protein
MQRRSFVIGSALGALTAAAHAGGKLRKVSFTQPDPPANEALPFLPRVLGPAPGDRVLRLQPRVATAAGETHSFLATSRQSFSDREGYRFSGQMRTLQQLRTGSKPNAWEVAWLFWNFADNNHLYYFILKPNGWEIGKRDPRYRVPGVNDGQKIMATGESMQLKLGEWNHFDVRVSGAQAEICIDGKFVTRFQDTDSAPLLGGRVGLYGEDAVCQWHDITAPVADRFASETQQPFADGTQLTHWDIAFLGYGSGGIVTSA